MVKRTEGWGTSFCSLVAFPPRKLTRSLGNEGAFPKSSARLNQTCFCTGPKDGHSATGFCGEGEHPLACVGTPPLCILPLDSDCQGQDEDEQFSHLSIGWECGGLRDGDKCLPGLQRDVLTHGFGGL